MGEISILDYNMGNISSVKRSVEKLGYTCKLISSPDEILNAKKIILPGVGHFKKAMDYIREHQLDESLNNVVMEKKIPILGICLGMQLMCKHSEEGNTNGLGWFDAKVTKINICDPLRYKTIHIGWNRVKFRENNLLNKSIKVNSEFYFVHEYCVQESNKNEIMCETQFESNFISGLNRENIFGVQFHPEKSHSVGRDLIRNFLELK